MKTLHRKCIHAIESVKHKQLNILFTNCCSQNDFELNFSNFSLKIDANAEIAEARAQNNTVATFDISSLSFSCVIIMPIKSTNRANHGRKRGCFLMMK